MDKWEYNLLQIGTGHPVDDLEAKMNIWGREGWELVAIQDTGGAPLWIFKRLRDAREP